jgi:two-component system response regulator NreC
MPDLTERELQVLTMVAEGLLNKDIGERLGISPRTVARHRENIMRKLHLHSRTDLVKYAIRLGLIDIDSA